MEDNKHSWIGFDPTDFNHMVIDNCCKKCGSKNFEVHKQGDFRETIYVEVCKNCGTKKS